MAGFGPATAKEKTSMRGKGRFMEERAPDGAFHSGREAQRGRWAKPLKKPENWSGSGEELSGQEKSGPLIG